MDITRPRPPLPPLAARDPARAPQAGYHIRPITAFVLTFVLTGLIPLAIAYWEMSLLAALPTNPHVAHVYLGTFFVWPFTNLILAPTVNMLIVMFYRSVDRAIATGIEEGALIERAPNALLRNFHNGLRAPLKIGVAVIAAAALTFLFWEVLGIRQKALDARTWVAGPYGGLSILFFAAIAIWFVEAFLLINVFVDFFRWCRLLRKVSDSNAPLQLRPVLHHKDGACGFSHFGRTALLGYLILFMLLSFVAVQIAEKYYFHAIYQQQPSVDIALIYRNWKAPVIGFAFLLVALPFAFTMPIRPLVSVLRRTKATLRDKHHLVSLRVSTALLDRIHLADDPEDLHEHYRALANIQDQWQVIRHIPSTPFDVRAPWIFLTTYIAPVGVTLFELGRKLLP